MEGKKKTALLSRNLKCPGCGSPVRIPLIWAVGIESVFRCRECGAGFGTGYKAGAVLFAVAFTLAVATVNLVCLVIGSWSSTLMFLACLPLWIFYGFALRKIWMVRRSRRRIRARER